MYYQASQLSNWSRLHDFQKVGVDFLIKRPNALLADEIGVGKTPQALMATSYLQPKNVLAIVTASIKYQWKTRAIEWGFIPEMIHVVTTKNVKRLRNETGFFIVNYDICWRKETASVLASKFYDVLICDESHYLKNQKSKRTKAVYGVGGYVSKARYRWLLTGTPVLNRPEELYTTLRVLCPERLGEFFDYIQFTKRYCGGHDGAWGWDASGATNIEELSKRLEGFMLRRELDVLDELPEKIMNLIHLERTKEMDKIIFDEGSADGEEAMKSVRKRMGAAKIKDSVKYVREVLETEDKVVLFAYHHVVLKALQDKLKEFSPVLISGETTPLQRQERVSTFVNNPKCRVFIGQVDAVGTGVDGLQESCKHGIFVELSYVPGINKQAMGRLHRNGQRHKTIFDFLVVEESMDENILQANLFKSEVAKKLMKDENPSFDFKTKQEGENIMDRVACKITIDAPFNTEVVEDVINQINKMNDINVTAVSLQLDVQPEGKVPAAKKKATKKRASKKSKEQEPPTEPPAVAGPSTAAPAAPAQPSAPVQAPAQPSVSATPAVSSGAPDPFASVEPAAQPEQSYEDFIRSASNRIQQKFSGNPTETNKNLTALNDKFKEAFPNYQNVLMVQNAEEQKQVRQIVTQHLQSIGAM